MIPRNRTATHPGIILEKEFLEPLGLSRQDLASHLGMAPKEVDDIMQGKIQISADTAWLLSEAFNTTPEFWLNLQAAHELSSHRPKRHVQPLVSVGG